jgi:hypothetical protein
MRADINGPVQIFGAFCSESWQVSDKYYGTGNSFLYMVHHWPCSLLLLPTRECTPPPALESL